MSAPKMVAFLRVVDAARLRGGEVSLAAPAAARASMRRRMASCASVHSDGSSAHRLQ
jgi:hypothetical protein